MSEERWEDPRHIKWSRAIKTRDYFTCQICSTGGYDVHLESHHMDSFDWCIEGRFDLKNGITLCKMCHQSYHKYTSYGNNTKENFLSYMKIAKIFRSVLSSASPENPVKEARELEEILNTQEDESNEGEE